MGDSDSHSWNHHSGSCQFDICRPQQTIRTSSMHFTAINYHASAQFVLYSFMIIIVFPFYACALLEGWGWLGICTRAHMVARCHMSAISKNWREFVGEQEDYTCVQSCFWNILFKTVC